MLTLGVVIWPPATISNGLLRTVGRSLLVVTDAALVVPAAPLVRPRSVICSWSPAFTKLPEKKPQLDWSVLWGLLQKPTSVLRVRSRIVPLCHSGAVVPPGRETVRSLPASADIPPVWETLNVITYRVRAPAAAEGVVMSTTGVVTLPPGTTVKAGELTGLVSMVVLTWTVLLLPAVPLVIPRSVTSTWSPALMDPPE